MRSTVFGVPHVGARRQRERAVEDNSGASDRALRAYLGVLAAAATGHSPLCQGKIGRRICARAEGVVDAVPAMVLFLWLGGGGGDRVDH